ncbi:hypothetical protein GCM10025865_01080 [Paraoerskovia sediminicola]|uniref:Uncharacterized protein n=1 Tax=Paraoerskovia sediminicola TaxID=1138587 RepID=A0ABM8FYI8_9CELL|nr:hypothetical protein [Paraoerskovia sediminicola]BDZ40809.1 hypothetical protein GCM10025865_01080 [Paraoerskovia sediminicola]
MKANGYGADLELTDDAVVIHPGKIAARVVGTKRIAVPLADITDIDYRPARALVNGQIKVKTATNPKSQAMQDYGNRGPIPPDGTKELSAYTRQGIITAESLVVHWRKKDQAAFEALHQAIEGARQTA